MSLDAGLFINVDTGGDEPYAVTLYDANITHNVSPMWRAAGVFNALYGHEEWDREDVTAAELIPVLENGLNEMTNHRARFEVMNPENGWGDYDGAVRFLFKLLCACREHPRSIYWYSA